MVLTLTERSVGSLKKFQEFLVVAENATKMDGEFVDGLFENRTLILKWWLTIAKTVATLYHFFKKSKAVKMEKMLGIHHLVMEINVRTLT